MICPECHHQVLKSDPYCSNCGHQFVVHLPGAGAAAGSVPVSKPLAGSMVHPAAPADSIPPVQSPVASTVTPQHEAARDPFAAAMGAEVAPSTPSASPFGAPASSPQAGATPPQNAPAATQPVVTAPSAARPQKSRGAKVARITIIAVVVVAIIAGAYVIGYETNFLGMGNPTPAHELPLTSAPIITD